MCERCSVKEKKKKKKASPKAKGNVLFCRLLYIDQSIHNTPPVLVPSTSLLIVHPRPLVGELDAPPALLPVVLAVDHVVEVPCKLGVGISFCLAGRLGSAGGAGVPLDLQGRCACVYGVGHDKVGDRGVGDLTPGGGGETLFLACFACAAEDAGDDLNAAETGGG